MKRSWVLGLGSWVVLVLGASAVLAQAPAPGAASGTGAPAIVLPRELDLELQLQVARDERDAALNRLENVQIQADQLLAIVNQFIAQMQSGRNEAANQARTAIAAKLVKALGGDPEKGDTYDWRAQALVKKDGTKVPVAKPEEKK